MIVVRGTEYLGFIRSQGDAFTTDTQYMLACPLNPGVSTTFSWLSGIARQFEFYQFEKLVVSYRPSVATSTGGRVWVYTDPDVMDPIPESLPALYASPATESASVWMEFQFDLLKRLSSVGRKLFVRGFSMPSGADPKTYDVGMLRAACWGPSAGTASGELFVDYVCRLSCPQPLDLPTLGKAFSCGASTDYPFGASTGAYAWQNTVGDFPADLLGNSLHFHDSFEGEVIGKLTCHESIGETVLPVFEQLYGKVTEFVHDALFSFVINGAAAMVRMGLKVARDSRLGFQLSNIGENYLTHVDWHFLPEVVGTSLTLANQTGLISDGSKVGNEALLRRWLLIRLSSRNGSSRSYML